MKQILFVDDEPKLLEALRRMLRRLRHEWDMEFVDGGQKALERLAETPFDVVVTDMRMPGMDGASCWRRSWNGIRPRSASSSPANATATPC